MSKNKHDMISWTSIYLKIKDEIFNIKFNVEMFFLDFYYVNIYSYFFKTWTPLLDLVVLKTMKCIITNN